MLYQDDGFGKSALDGVIAALQRRNLKMAASAGYERNTEKVEAGVDAIKVVDAQAIIMVANNKPAAASIKRYREAGGSAQL